MKRGRLSIKQWALATFAMLHLLLIGLSSAKISVGEFFKSYQFLRLVDVYSYVSGAGYHYGFFAPGVTSQLKVSYRSYSQDVMVSEGDLQTSNLETTFRVHNLLEYIWETQEKPELRRSIAASLAGKVFARFPSAEKVTIEIKAFVLPSMSESRAGAKSEWEDYYTADFKRSET